MTLYSSPPTKSMRSKKKPYICLYCGKLQNRENEVLLIAVIINTLLIMAAGLLNVFKTAAHQY